MLSCWKHYQTYIAGNEAIEMVTTRAISLLTMDIKTHKLIGVRREMMEKALKNLKIGSKILVKRSYIM